MVAPFFFIAEIYLEKENVGKELTPIIGLLFNVKDRGVRAALLSKVTLLSEHLDKNTLNASVFEPLCSGFSDSSPALRELTLKSTVVLVPSLTAPNLEKLSRYLIRLQSDSETSIRTNSVIFIAKLASHLTTTSQQKLLLPAFCRAMKDGFTPCRLAALQSTLKTKQYFSMPEIATKVLPAVMPLLLDPMENVRKEAFSVVDTLLVSLRAESDRMAVIAQEEALKQQQQQQQQQQGSSSLPIAPTSAPAPSVAAAPASGSYLTGLSSWMSSSTKATASTATATEPPQVMAPAPSTAPFRMPPAQVVPPVQQHNHAAATTAPSLNVGPIVDDGWGEEDEEGDGWGDDDLNNASASSKPGLGSSLNNSNNMSVPPTQSTTNRFSADLDDPFASIGAMPAKAIAPRPRGAMNSGGKLILPKNAKSPLIKKAAPTAPATKLKIDKEEVEDGWDDF